MKKLIIILIISLLISCKGKETDKVIVIKTYKEYNGDYMKKGLCRYYYKTHDGFDGNLEFIDSCIKYNIGDTIIGTIKH